VGDYFRPGRLSLKKRGRGDHSGLREKITLVGKKGRHYERETGPNLVYAVFTEKIRSLSGEKTWNPESSSWGWVGK